MVSSVLFSQDDSTLFVGSRDKKIYALSVETGTKLWEFQADSYVESPPVLSPNGAFLAVAPMDNKVYSLVADREAIGAIAWTFETDMMMISEMEKYFFVCLLDHWQDGDLSLCLFLSCFV